MRYNKLGDSGLLVSELSFGAWVTFQVRCAPTACTAAVHPRPYTYGVRCTRARVTNRPIDVD